MKRHDIDILNETTVFTLSDVCRSCGTNTHFVYELVQEGVVRPRGPNARGRVNEWVFDGRALHRVQRAQRLHRDLHVNVPGIALALELLERLEKS